MKVFVIPDLKTVVKKNRMRFKAMFNKKAYEWIVELRYFPVFYVQVKSTQVPRLKSSLLKENPTILSCICCFVGVFTDHFR